jgi:hypothetical protein
MPLVIDYPGPTGQIGPGYPVAFSGAAGPVPIDDYFVASIVDPNNELVVLMQGAVASQGQTFGIIVMGVNASSPIGLGVPQLGFPVGSTVRLLVEQFHANHTKVASISQSMIYDPTSMLWNYGAFQWGGGTQTGSFTTTDRQTIQQTEEATIATFPAQLNGLTQIPFNLGELVTELPKWLASATTGVQITGRGNLTRPGGLFNINALGIQWEFVSVPPHLGVRDGAVEEYYERILQLVLVGRDAGAVEYVDQVVESSVSGERITWGLSPPYRLLFDVLPGVVVQYHWLLV